MDENKGVPPVYTPPQEAYPPPQQGYPPPQQGYPPPQQGYPPQQAYPPQGYPPQQGATNVVVIQQPAAQPVRFGPLPVTITDSNGQQVTTRLEHRAGTLTWLICCAVCWLTGCWCFALIPCCIDGAKDVYHYSPTDNKLVGVYKRI